jgi:hypothetical protein
MNPSTQLAKRISLLMAVALAGCGKPGPPRAPVQGNVTVGGQPLAAGRILFVPLPPAKGPAASARVVNGEYRLTRADGPVAGQNRVEIEADPDVGFAIDDEAAYARRGKPLPPHSIPLEFNRQSTLVAEVTPDQENTFDVAIPAARHALARPRD